MKYMLIIFNCIFLYIAIHLFNPSLYFFVVNIGHFLVYLNIPFDIDLYIVSFELCYTIFYIISISIFYQSKLSIK